MDQSLSSPPIPNMFANDGSFFDQFRKKMANNSKTTTEPIVNPHCQKQRPGFRPKTACKPINLKASLKKQLKNTLAAKSTLETKSSTKRYNEKQVFEAAKQEHVAPASSTRDIEEEAKVLKRLRENPPPKSDELFTSSESSEGTRKRKKKSRWGEKAPTINDVPTVPIPMLAPSISPSLAGHSPSIVGHSPSIMGHSPSIMGHSPSIVGHSISPDKPLVTVINGVPITIPVNKDTPPEVTVKALQSLLKTNKNKYEYDSDEETDGNGTWEHRQRSEELKHTISQIQSLNSHTEGKHHLGDFIPSEELQRFMEKVNHATALKSGLAAHAPISNTDKDMISPDNVGFKMLQKAGWKEGSGLGAYGNGITTPIDRGMIKPGTAGLGALKPDEPTPGDDEFDVYRKRMMLAYKFRPNPMNNPRRAYY